MKRSTKKALLGIVENLKQAAEAWACLPDADRAAIERATYIGDVRLGWPVTLSLLRIEMAIKDHVDKAKGGAA